MAKTLLEQWRSTAYSEQADKQILAKLWTEYFEVEKGVYAQILEDTKNPVKGTVKELSEKLRKAHIPHEVLNAKNHAREAEIIAKAGEKGSVTIAEPKFQQQQ